MFTYAGIALSDAGSSEAAGWIAENIRPHEVFPLAYRTWPPGMAGGPVLNTSPDNDEPITVGSLKWPVGASRFARGHFVVTNQQMLLVQRQVYSNGTQRSRPFYFADGTNSITANLWTLPFLPLAQGSPVNGMWLMTVVDDRYWWWGYGLEVDTLTTWEALYAEIGSVIGTTVSVDPIDADYGDPVDSYLSYNQPLPPIFDAIAFSVGQRVVRSLEGAISAQNYDTASAAVTANRAAGWVPFVGGAYNFNWRDG